MDRGFQVRGEGGGLRMEDRRSKIEDERWRIENGSSGRVRIGDRRVRMFAKED
jgi:hypothetical protein